VGLWIFHISDQDIHLCGGPTEILDCSLRFWTWICSEGLIFDHGRGYEAQSDSFSVIQAVIPRFTKHHAHELVHWFTRATLSNIY
jgi:hypothetical protein